MRAALIGHTGFIGSNLATQHSFTHRFNSSNIRDIRGGRFDLVVCAGVSALKWWANGHPAEDLARIDALLGELTTVEAGRVVLMSSVDVYPVLSGVDETFDCHSRPNHPYGTHRLHVEDVLRDRFRDVTVVRIGGVFGPGLKKNVVYDLLHDNGLETINPASSFQYYNVSHLWTDVERVLAAGIRLVNFITEPLRTSDVIERCFREKAVGAAAGPEAHYDVRTLHSAVFGGPSGYMAPAERTLEELAAFVTEERNRRPS